MSALPWAAGTLLAGVIGFWLGRRGWPAHREDPRAIALPAPVPLVHSRERERADRLMAAIDSLEHPLYVTNPRYEVVLANRACFRFYGLAPSDGLALLQARMREREALKDLISLAIDNPDRSVVTAIARSDAEEPDHKVYAAPLLDEAGRSQGRVVIMQDVTLERRFSRELAREVAEKTAQLQAALVEQQELDRAKTAFVANMNHELRTPLNAVWAYASSLLDGMFGQLNDEQQKALERVMEGAETLRDLINDVLDFSRLDAGQVDVSRTEVDPTELIESALELLWGQSTQKGLTLTSQIAPDLPPLWGEFGKLRQVLTNLLTNALKYTEAGGRVWVTAEQIGERIRLGVHDTGIGIAREHHAKLFDRFYRVDQSFSRSYGGTGLGLAIVSQLIDLHEGRIWIESEPGEGSHFFVELPVAPLVAGRQPSSVTLAERREGPGS